MSDLLEQLGITREEVIDKIVNKALGAVASYRQTGEETWEDIPLHTTVDKKIKQSIDGLMESMKVQINGRIDEILANEISRIFSGPFQQVNTYGEPVGELTTVREMIMNFAKNYWNDRVDSNGKPAGQYVQKAMTRAEFQAKAVIDETYKTLLSTSVTSMMEEIKKEIPDTIAKELAQKIVYTMFRR
jgi:hypothetical protein